MIPGNLPKRFSFAGQERDEISCTTSESDFCFRQTLSAPKKPRTIHVSAPKAGLFPTEDPTDFPLPVKKAEASHEFLVSAAVKIHGLGWWQAR